MFETIVTLLLFGSFTFASPVRADGDELWTVYSLAFIAILALVFPKKRTLDFRLPALFLSAVMILMFCHPPAQPLRMSFAHLFMGVFAIKCVAERWAWSMRRFGAVLFLFHALTLVVLRMQMLGMDLFYMPLSGQISGTFIMPWALGCFCALSVPFLFALHPIAVLFVLPGLFYSHNAMAVFASIIGVALMLPRFSKTAVVASVIGTACAVYFFHIGLDVARFKIWTGAFPFIKSFIWGNGLGSWAHEGFARNNGVDLYYWRFAHNEFYQLFFEVGTIGIVIGGAVWGWLFWKKSRITIATMSIMTLLCLFHSMLHYGRLALFCVLITAFAIKDRKTT